jgi:uncharacterized protein
LGLDQLRARLLQHHRVALDSCIFIYQLEANSRYVSLTDSTFRWLIEPSSRAVTSTLTMTEVLVPAYRIRDQKRIDNFYGFLSTYPNLEWLSVDIELADIAARIRAQHNLRTPDAIQAATAIQFGATLLITNDPIFKRITEFHTLVLDDFV